MAVSVSDPGELTPLPGVLSRGLVAVTFFGFLSFICSVALFLWLSYRLWTWRRYRPDKPMNQFLFLIYNLVLADIQQSLAFLLNANALRRDGIFINNSLCWAQGWFISTGDLSGSIFICAIAIHTFLGVVKNYRLPAKIFYPWVACCWIFNYGLAMLGPLIRDDDFFARAGAWCWINTKYNSDRLWLHYFWLFVFMFSTILIYGVIFVVIGYRVRNKTINKQLADGAKPLMILYPAIYTICTTPLAIGRIVALSGVNIPLAYFCLAGSMIACNGWMDVLLYATTRAEIIINPEPPSDETGLETFAFLGRGHRLGTTTTVEALGRKHSDARGRTRMTSASGDSIESLYGIEVRGEVMVQFDGDKAREMKRKSMRVRSNQLADNSPISDRSEDDSIGGSCRKV